MSSSVENRSNFDRRTPFYQIVDGFRIPGLFSADAFRSALAYKPRPDDLFLVTFPKCGTTWVQHIIACIYKDGKPFESAAEFLSSTPFLQMTGAEVAETMKRPAAIKLHLPYYLTPMSPKAKYIFVARNPKDCCVSFYHHTESTAGYQFIGSFDDFFEIFIEGQTDFGDYFDTVRSWYDHRNDPNVLFITYEELKKDIVPNVLKIADFMGSQYSEALEQNEKFLQDVIHHSSLSFMKEHVNKFIADFQNLPKDEILNNPDLPTAVKELFTQRKGSWRSNEKNVKFVRKGVVGDWKNYFSPEQNSRLEHKFKEKLGDTELAKIWQDVM